MSVLIEGMEMPKKGSWISLRVFPDGQCFLYSWCGNDFDFMEHLTAAPVQPHGRLIDADALHYSRIRIAHDDGTIGGYNAVVMSAEIKDAPTIIEAEEGT